MKPHKHAELIKAWADGAEIQVWNTNVENWVLCSPYMAWEEEREYRIKPEPKPDDEITRLIKQRDSYRGWADRLANAISEHFDYDIGEHSSANCPWTNAMVCIESPQPIKPEPKTDVVLYGTFFPDVDGEGEISLTIDRFNTDQFKFVFDGETLNPKSVEVLP